MCILYAPVSSGRLRADDVARVQRDVLLHISLLLFYLSETEGKRYLRMRYSLFY